MAEGDNDTCLELALEGEKLCKAGKCTFLIIIVNVVTIQPSVNLKKLNDSSSVFHISISGKCRDGVAFFEAALQVMIFFRQNLKLPRLNFDLDLFLEWALVL